jgi:hypothetical protein
MRQSGGELENIINSVLFDLRRPESTLANVLGPVVCRDIGRTDPEAGAAVRDILCQHPCPNVVIGIPPVTARDCVLKYDMEEQCPPPALPVPVLPALSRLAMQEESLRLNLEAALEERPRLDQALLGLETYGAHSLAADWPDPIFLSARLIQLYFGSVSAYKANPNCPKAIESLYAITFALKSTILHEEARNFL